MAAGDPIAMTNTLITALNADQTLTYNAADADTANLAQIFNYTPTGKGSKVLVGLVNASADTAMTYSIAVGAGVFQAAAAKTGSIAAAKTEVIEIEVGRFKNASGKVAITVTPGSGKKLLTDHAANVWVAELI